MQIRSLAAVLGTALLVACGQDAQTVPADTEPAMLPDGSTAVTPQMDLFVEAPTAAAQLVFVGQDRSNLPAGRTDAVFVPFSTFSIERDGIPNEFPEADSMAAMLEAAGVGAERFVIVGDPIPAGRAYAAFDWLGLGDRATLLDGGPAALTSEPPATPQPDAADEPRAAPGAARSPEDTRTGRRSGLDIDVNDDMIVDAEWVMQRIDDPSVAILDARPPAEFSGETPGDGIGRPGHIPGARNVFWQTLVQSPDNPRLKDETELRRIFEQAGVGPGDTVVAYCRTGGQASFLYTVARHLGYDVKLYDGSFVDWSRTEYPVER